MTVSSDPSEIRLNVTEEQAGTLADDVPVGLRGAVKVFGEPMPPVFVFPPQMGEVEVHAREPTAVFQILDPLPHGVHQLTVEDMYGFKVCGGRNAEPDLGVGGEADLAVVLVSPIHRDLVAIAADGTPESELGRVA